MDVAGRIELIRELCSFEGRGPGTDAERRAANHLAQWLRRSGRRAEIEPTFVHPQYALVHALHVAVAIAGSVIAMRSPAIGFALVLFAATSMYWDLHARVYLLRRLFFRRASQNVVSPGARPEAPARVILTAHYDAARSGLIFRPKSVARAARLQARLPFAIGPFRVLFWSIFALLPFLGLRMAGIEANWVSLLQVIPTLILVAALWPLTDIALSPVVPGANDNASGVATVVALAEELDRREPANLDVWVLLTGAEECLEEGMRAFLRAHGEELEQQETHFIVVDTVGHGTVRYKVSEGFIFSYRLNHRLIELSEAVAEADRRGPSRYGARPWRSGLADDSLPPHLAGHASIQITCLNEENFVPHYHQPDDVPANVDPAALERAHGFLSELIGALEADVGRRAAAR